MCRVCWGRLVCVQRQVLRSCLRTLLVVSLEPLLWVAS
jgi:hypothetical protein